MATVILIEALPLPAAGTTAVAVRLAGGGSRAYDHKGFKDWLSGIVTRPRFTSAIGFDASGPTGGAIPQTGSVRFSTVDKARLSTIAGYYWTGARIVVSIGDDSTAAPAWTVIMTGTVADAKTDGAGILFTISDLSGDLNKVICPATFAGTGGIEGGADATGRLKRRSFGECYNVEARLLDKANNIYEVGDPSKPLNLIKDVRDKAVSAQNIQGLAWQGSIAATFSALQAAAVPTGGCVFAQSIACVKWWTVPTGPLTVDLSGDATGGYAAYARAVVSRILITFAPTITFANYAALTPELDQTAGIHCDDSSETVASLLNRFLLPLFYVPILDPAGDFYARKIKFTGPVETLTFDTCDRDTVYPPLLLRSVGYQRNYRVQSDSEIAADIDALGAFTLINRANMYIAGSTVAKVNGALGNGNASVYSLESYATPALNFTAPKTGEGQSIGFRKASVSYAGYSSLSEGFDFVPGTSNVQARYSGAVHGSFAYIAGSRFQLKDDGTTVHFIIDSVEVATSPSDGSAKILDSDFYAVGDEVNNISFSATGAAGAAGISPYLTNPAVTVSSAADGTGASYTAAGGSMIINLGGVPIVAGVTYSVVSGSTSGGITISINSTTGAYTISGLTGDSGGATLRATYNGHDYDLVYSISKSKTGAAAPVLTLQPTANAFTYDSSGTLTGANSISLPAIIQGATGTATYTAQAYNSANTALGSVTLGGSGNNRTLSAAAFLAAPTTAYVIVTATLGALSDTSTIYKLVAGSNVITAILTNEAATVAADSAGTVASFAAAGGTMQLFSGASAVGSGVVYSVVSGSPTGGLSISINSSSGVYTISGLTADSGSCTLRATYNSIPYDKVYNLSKSKAGATGASGLAGIGTTSLSFTGTGVSFDGVTLDCATDAGGSFTNSGAWSNTPIGGGATLTVQASHVYTGGTTDVVIGLRSTPSSSFSVFACDLGAFRFADYNTGAPTTGVHYECFQGGGGYATGAAPTGVWNPAYSYQIKYDPKSGITSFYQLDTSGNTTLLATYAAGAGKNAGIQATFGKKGRFTSIAFGSAGADGAGAGAGTGAPSTFVGGSGTGVVAGNGFAPVYMVAGAKIGLYYDGQVSYNSGSGTNTVTGSFNYSLTNGASYSAVGGTYSGSRATTINTSGPGNDLAFSNIFTAPSTGYYVFQSSFARSGGGTVNYSIAGNMRTG